KCYYPAAFCAGIINSQPMGFYSPSQLIRDARAHGVRVLPADVNFSGWDCRLESFKFQVSGSKLEGNGTNVLSTKYSVLNTQYSLRLGLRVLTGIPKAAAEKIEAAREAGEF